MKEIQESPWYRQFWPWFIMVPPATAVIAGLLTVYLAGAEPAMVVDDYGRIAMATAQRVERAERATELGMDARVMLAAGPDAGEQLITVTLTQRGTNSTWPAGLVLQLVHPTQQQLDQTIELSGSDGGYTAQLRGNTARRSSRYYVSLSDADATWRLTGELAAGATSFALHAADRRE